MLKEVPKQLIPAAFFVLLTWNRKKNVKVLSNARNANGNCEPPLQTCCLFEFAFSILWIVEFYR